MTLTRPIIPPPFPTKRRQAKYAKRKIKKKKQRKDIKATKTVAKVIVTFGRRQGKANWWGEVFFSEVF